MTLKGVVSHATHNLSWIPVDFVARAIITLGRAPTTKGQTFHLCGDGPSITDVVNVMKEKGHVINKVSSEQWKSLLNQLPVNHPGMAIKSALETMDFGGRTHVVPTDRTRRTLEENGMDWYTVTPPMIDLGISYLAKALGEKNEEH